VTLETLRRATRERWGEASFCSMRRFTGVLSALTRTIFANNEKEKIQLQRERERE
jgi:hypothetical protein